MISLQELENRIASTTKADEVDVVIVNTPFQILNYNFENPSAGGLTLNETTELFSQIANKPPFYSMHTSIISPTKNMAKGASVTFKFNTNLYLTNGGNNIKTLVIDFGNTSKTIINNGNFIAQTVSIPYYQSGTKAFTSYITYTNNETLTTKGSFYFHYENTGQQRSSTGLCNTNDFRTKDDRIVAEESFKGYETNDPRIFAEIECRTFYADASFHSDLNIYKPVIILDGFDPGDKRKIQDCDCEADGDCASENTTNGVYDPIEHESMEDFQEYQDGLQTENLLNQLREKGYDVIMVNHPTYKTLNIDTGQEVTIDGGAYYIESNALTLVSLIKQVKADLAHVGSTEEIIILGPSMGGQISRYALAYMEKKYAETGDEDWNHNTKLWVSVDSPHLGANIPIGDQALIYQADDIGNSDAAADFYNNQLGSIAAKQQLIEYHRDAPNHHLINEDNLNGRVASQGYPSDDGSSYFRTYYTAQETNGLAGSHGYPQNLRKIALVNGSLTGKTIGSDSELVLNIRGFQRVNIDLPWPLGSITFRVHVASLESYFMPTYNTGYQKVSRFKKGFDNRTHKSPNINSRGNMDIVPGGWFAAQNDLAKSILGTEPINGVRGSFWEFPEDNFIYWLSSVLAGDYFELREFRFNHSFIPSFSAIAHKNPDQSWLNPLDYNLVCADETYFDSYFGYDENTQHTSFTLESAEWLFKELAGNAQAPYFPISPDKLLGEDYICNAETFTFDSCSTPEGVQNWEVSSNLQILNSTTNAVTVKPNVSYPANGWIKAIFNASSSLTKNIQLNNTLLNTNDFNVTDEYYNAVSGSGSFNDPFLVCPNSSYILGYSGNSVVDLSTMSNVILPYGWSGYSYGALELLFTPGNFYGNPERIDISYQGECGNALHSVYFAEDSFNCSGGWFSYRVAPNPAVSDELSIVNIENEDTIKRIKPNAKVEFLLYNDQSILKKQKREKGNKKEYKLDVSKLKNGFYYLKIIREEKTEMHKVVIYR